MKMSLLLQLLALAAVLSAVVVVVHGQPEGCIRNPLTGKVTCPETDAPTQADDGYSTHFPVPVDPDTAGGDTATEAAIDSDTIETMAPTDALTEFATEGLTEALTETQTELPTDEDEGEVETTPPSTGDDGGLIDPDSTTTEEEEEDGGGGGDSFFPPDTVGGSNTNATKASTLSPTTLAPTIPLEPNPCMRVKAGDVQVVVLNSEQPDQLAFFTLDNVPASAGPIYVTDKPWNGTHLLENGEGTMMMEIPETTTRTNDDITCNGLCAAYMYGYGFDIEKVNWTQHLEPGQRDYATTFDLGLGGDTVLTYCLETDGKTPHFIHAFNYANSTWAEPGLSEEEYGKTLSALPESLAVNGSVDVGIHYGDQGYIIQNCVFNGTTTSESRKDNLMPQYADPSNYDCSSSTRYKVAELEDQSSAIISTAASSWMMILSSLASIAILI